MLVVTGGTYTANFRESLEATADFTQLFSDSSAAVGQWI